MFSDKQLKCIAIIYSNRVVLILEKISINHLYSFVSKLKKIKTYLHIQKCIQADGSSDLFASIPALITI